MTGAPPVLGGNAGGAGGDVAGGAVTGAAVGAGGRRAVGGGVGATVVDVVLVDAVVDVLVLVLVDVVARLWARIVDVTLVAWLDEPPPPEHALVSAITPALRRARRRISSPSLGQIGRRGLRT
jgi:hypothetical protein